MKSTTMLWPLLLFVSTVVYPQLLGALVYFRLIRFSRLLAHALWALTPAVLFFYLAPSFFFAGLREAEANGPVPCGMPALAAAFMVIVGTWAHLFVNLIIQLVYLIRKKSALRTA